MLLVVLGGVGLSLPLASAPAALTSTVDFESGPPIGEAIDDDYRATAFVYWQRSDPRFRPYRRSAGVATHSGTVAADIGPDHCYPGEEDAPCELVTPGTLARLSRLATSVTLYAGLFMPSSGSVSATLTAYNAAGTRLSSSTVPIGVGITTLIRVTSPAANIARFELVAEGQAGIGAQLGFDDLTLQFPDTPPVSPPIETCPGNPTVGPDGVRVSSAAQLDALLRRSDFRGRVIVPRDEKWEMKDCGGNPLRQIPLHSGVELIGERGELGSRPLLYVGANSAKSSLFEITGNDVLVEGLHLRGHKPAEQHAKREPYLHAIQVVEDAEQRLGRRVLIADNEFEQWTGAAVDLIGGHGSIPLKDWNPAWTRLERQDARLVRIERNYMHHNVMDGGGYGVDVEGGAYGYVAGNLFDFNRHSVAATGKAYQGYVARFNYVLQDGIKQGSSYNQHFDVHGSGKDEYGGYAGEYFEIAYNTIRGKQSYGVKNRPAFMLRGRPGDPRDHRAGVVNGAYFNANVAVHDDLDQAVSLKWANNLTSKAGVGERHKKFNFHASGNRFGTDYSTEVAAGDFDGDGRTDVFLANGTAWFFSRAGIRPWEFLHASNKRTHQLGFADIDNDRVTDVLYRDSSGELGYLKSGRFGLAPLTSSPVPMKDLRFGDFDGDGSTDIFYTRNRKWQVWYGGTRAWTRVQTSRASISELLFGEFDEVRGTDVASVQDGAWSYSSGATRRWARLNRKRAGSFESAVAADFDGNGRTDIAFIEGRKWVYSRDGRSPLVAMRSGAVTPSKPLLVGVFAPVGGSRRAQVAKWVDVLRPNVTSPLSAGLRLIVWRGLGTGHGFYALSTQNMR